MFKAFRTKNFFVTGPPGAGKSRLIQKVIEFLQRDGFKVGGITCPEVRRHGRRWGFKIINLITKEEGILASIDVPEGPRVSKYRVNMKDLERAAEWLRQMLDNPKFHIIVVDEIGKMECFSQKFCSVVRNLLDSEKPVIGVVSMKKSAHPLIAHVYQRPDTKVYFLPRGASNEYREKIAREIYSNIKKILHKD